MAILVNGYASVSDLINDNTDFYIIATLIPCLNTGVVYPLDYLKNELKVKDDISSIGGFKVNGILYINDKEYHNAFINQKNLNYLAQLISLRSAPIMLSVSDSGVVDNVSLQLPNNTHFSDFGNNHKDKTGKVYYVKFSTSHELVWNNSTELAIHLDKKIAYDVDDNTTYFITNNDKNEQYPEFDGIINRNTLILKNNFV